MDMISGMAYLDRAEGAKHQYIMNPVWASIRYCYTRIPPLGKAATTPRHAFQLKIGQAARAMDPGAHIPHTPPPGRCPHPHPTRYPTISPSW